MLKLAEVRRIGIIATMIDPRHPEDEIKVNIKDRQRVREFSLATGKATAGGVPVTAVHVPSWSGTSQASH